MFTKNSFQKALNIVLWRREIEALVIGETFRHIPVFAKLLHFEITAQKDIRI